MRIIELGNIDLTFRCPRCGTLFEISTKELREENGNWKTQCPLCFEEMNITLDRSIREFLVRRKELEQQ